MKLYELVEVEKWMLEVGKGKCLKCGFGEFSIYQRTLLAQMTNGEINYVKHQFPLHVAECANCGEFIQELWD